MHILSLVFAAIERSAYMGIYFNPNNRSFTCDKNSKIYIDKTQLLSFLNERLETNDKYIAVSHARRFGKSHAAGMIDAYYSLGSDSAKLFENTKIASFPDYRKYMNKYNVIHLDISSVWDFHKEHLIESIHDRLCEDFQKIYHDTLNYKKDLYLLIWDIYSITEVPFVIIIDEWDCVIRNSDELELAHNTYTSVLKYNKSADTALRQIKEKRYHGALTEYKGKILLVGINYSSEENNKKHHTCVIEEWE